MKVLYDHQIFTTQKYGGISRYFYELINVFDDGKEIQTKTPLRVSNNHYISDESLIKHANFFPHKEFRGKYRLMMEWNKIATLREIKKQNFDVFHPTYYDPYFLKYIGQKPFVLTVYDMIHEKFHNLFPQKDRTSHHKKLLVEKASRIIAISHSTKKDLIEIFGTDESKIDVVYLGNSMFPKSNSTLVLKLPQKYILFVGSRNGYKNFDRFLRGVASLLLSDKELYVLCAGSGAFKAFELKQMEDLNIASQFIQYDVNDDTLASLYQNAQLFVFPSLYEGFGIPVLESFACDCPLVCSNTSSLPEIAGEGAYYFDPYSETSIQSAIFKVLNDKTLREQLVLNGRARLKKFSWKETAMQTQNIYENLLK
jgi:glycosyltransferase involved in cell wall biosynthesis